MELLTQLFGQLPGLVGFAALFVVVNNIGKLRGIVTPENEPLIQAGESLLLLVALYVTQVLNMPTLIPGFDPKAAYLATAIGAILQFLTQFGALKLGHAIVRGVPYVGASFEFTREVKEINPQAKLLGMPNVR